MMDYKKLSKSIRFDNASKGFDPTEGGLDRYLLLTISEICEAQEELRDGRDPRQVYFLFNDNEQAEAPSYNGVPGKPLGFPVELADAIIRILDIFGKFDEDPVVIEGALVPIRDGDIESILLKAVKFVGACQGGYMRMRNDETPYVQALVWHNLNMALSLLITLAHTLQIEIEAIIEQKLAYNKSRPPKHGRKF